MLKICMTLTFVASFYCLYGSDSETERSLLGSIPYFQEDYDSHNEDFSSATSVHQVIPAAPAINYAVTTTSRTLTAEQLQAIRERQMATLASEPKKTAIGTAWTFHCRLAQQSIYEGKVYKKIPFDEFARQYNDEVEDFTQRVRMESVLDEDFTNELYDNITANPGQKEFSTYKIVGEMPSTDGFREGLFNLDFAREYLQELIHSYIDRNHAQVREKCLKKGLAPTISKEVWSPCRDCDQQMHRSCVKLCFQNDVDFCSGAYCPGSADRSGSTPGNWTPALYKKIFKKPPVVPVSKIKNENCPICYENLLPPSIVAAIAATAARDLRPAAAAQVPSIFTSAAVDETSTTSSSTHKKKRPRNRSHRSRIEGLEEF
jgi:hypothetical protein